MALGFQFVNFLAANRKNNLIPFNYFSPSDPIGWIASDNSFAVMPYSTTTITASPMTIAATVHGQGVFAWGMALDSSGNVMLSQWNKDSAGNLTLTYAAAPHQIIIYP